MMAVVLSLSLFSNVSNAIGFKLNCEINEFKKLKSKSKSKLLDLVNIQQTHEFIGRDVKLSKTNLFGELKYNGLHYGKKLEWIHYVDDLIIKYVYYANKSKIGQGRLNIEASYRKKPFQAKKLLFDYNGTCFFQKIEKPVLAEAENLKIIIKEDKESKKLAEQEKQKRIELEKKLAELEKKSQSKVIVEDETNKRLAEEEKQKRLKEEQKRKELEQKLAILSKKNNVNVDKLVEDNKAPVISAQSKQDGFYATIFGTIIDDVKLAEVLIDNKLITLKTDGSFNTKLYVPRNGLQVKILAFDMKGNKSTKTLKVERGAIEEASGPIFASLDPSAKKVKSNPNALALIVGVADYERTNADAIYADKDAQQFYDYATLKLGIPSSNIKELVNDKADLGEILINVKDWLRRSAKPTKSDIYIYFAGHGLASDDGSKMYLLPYDGRPRLLENTAVLRDKLFSDLSDINPRSVTVFLDTCYSGTTRGTDMLIASRPIAIRAIEQSIPDNFTVFSAAAGDQTSKPLEEAKHGMFSYFLMKGMEGNADTNNDNKITARELHAYVEQNVVQQSSGSQTPELQGDKDRVLVQFN